MLNGEHYQDPTASVAVDKVSRSDLRYHPNPAYVSHGFKPMNFAHKTINVDEMDMAELKPYINSCAKSQMNPEVCVSCNPGCVFGRRAIELIEQAKKQEEPKKMNKAAISSREKAIQEYKAAIESGDVLQYAIDHAKNADPKKARHAAMARVSLWRKNYGMLISENPKPKTNPVPVETLLEDKPKDEPKELPHLMQMPCLSKKVAAEKAAAEKAAHDSAGIAQVFKEKLDSLNNRLKDIQRQIEDLMQSKETIEQQIGTIEASAGILDVSLM